MQFAWGKQYVGSTIQYVYSQATWIAEKVNGWVFGVRMVAATAKGYLQTACNDSTLVLRANGNTFVAPPWEL